MGRSKQAPLRLLWKGRAWAVQGPKCEPACEHQENTQGVKDGEEENLEGLEVEEDVEAQAAMHDDDGPFQKRRRPSKTVRTNTSRSRTWVVSAAMMCNPFSPTNTLQTLQWVIPNLRPEAGCRGYLGDAHDAV